MGSKSKSKTTSNQTTTPVISQPYDASFKGFTGQIDNFMKTDPTQYVAPASELQKLAFEQAKSLGGHTDAASAYAAQGANAPAGSVKFTGYQAPKLGNASTYDGAKLADPKRLLQYMGDYQNPYTSQVIDATMADYDQYAGQQRAGMAADAAKTAAFGGSRYGIAQGQLEGELARGRASTIANLLDQKYRLSAELAGQDANAANTYGLHQGDLTQQAKLASMAAKNQFALSQADLNANAAQFGANAANQQSAMNASLLEQQYQRALQAAGIETNLGNQAVANLGAVASLGDTQREIQRAQLNAIPNQLMLGSQLYGNLNPALYAGTNQTGTSTTTQKNSGLGSWLMPLVGTGLQAGATYFGQKASNGAF